MTMSRLLFPFSIFVLVSMLSASLAVADSSNQEFWSHWGDGKAELAAYDLTYPRYGSEREGSADSSI